MKVEEDAAKAKYTFSEIYDYVVHKTYPSHADKLYKHGLRKRSKFFTADGERLYYIGGKGSKKPRLVVESTEERRRIIGSILIFFNDNIVVLYLYILLHKHIFTLAYTRLVNLFLYVFSNCVPKSLKDPHITRVLGTPGPHIPSDMGPPPSPYH